MVSLTQPLARRIPEISAQSPPPRNPRIEIQGMRSQAGREEKFSAPQVANRAPIWSCPSPPTLISQILAGKATATAVRGRGIILTSTSEKP